MIGELTLHGKPIGDGGREVRGYRMDPESDVMVVLAPGSPPDRVRAVEQLVIRLTSERPWRWRSETGHVVIGDSKIRADPTGQMPTEAEQHLAELRAVARQVITAWKSGDLAAAMQDLATLVEDEPCSTCGGTRRFWANGHAPDCTHLTPQP